MDIDLDALQLLPAAETAAICWFTCLGSCNGFTCDGTCGRTDA
ncbi:MULTISPECIES: ALQxL family class IV lanthipeptide [Streptomyces]|uniref:ALQxL family class IV lanthipeptide n=1 Tax=Streptomyces lonegramiae TaxID=3075524 RepID=A0ABU2XMK5_9ACTN|nr:ALQxL family class IV lanthipeptide [Streptomyces sp. DSM 41529]MDT0547047.1 ALQxL family class IV lanthipeptide [Streptomyces sp. DSM 41529]